MKKIKKALAILAAAVMATSCTSVVASAAETVSAEEYSVLDSTEKLVQEALDSNADKLGEELYDAMTEGEVPLYRADESSEQSELEKAAIEKGMYKDTFSFANHLCTLSSEDFQQKVYDVFRNNLTDSELSNQYALDAIL